MIHNQLKESIKRVIGQLCWGIVAGIGTGSVISMQCGKKVLVQKRIKNSHLSEDLQKYEGEICFFVWCAWRVESAEKVICTSTDDNSEGASMLEGLKKITHQKIVDFDLSFPGFDLALHFDNALKLKIFCDQTNHKKKNDNYIIFFPEVTYGIRDNSEIEIILKEKD